MWPFKSKIEEPIESSPCSFCVELKTHIENQKQRLKQVIMENTEIPSLRQTILSLEANLLKQKRERAEADLLLVSAKIIKSILDTGNNPPTQLINNQAELYRQMNAQRQVGFASLGPLGNLSGARV